MKGATMKIVIAGVGGQGVVYLTNLLVEAALIADMPISVSEIHGLSQRGGVVTAGIGLGEHTTGFIGTANVDFLIGLEPLETQRCIQHLHKNSSVIFGNYRIAPYSVNAQTAEYPDVKSFLKYLTEQCHEVMFIEEFPKEINSVHYNIFLLGKAVGMKDFPFSSEVIEQAIENSVTDYQREKTLAVFHLALNNELRRV